MAIETERLVREVEVSSVSWRAIFAGTVISLFVFGILSSLGLAVGGATLKGVIQGTADASSLGIGSGIWLIVSALISIFIGAYISGRAAGLVTLRVGRVQGWVIAALFFAVALSQVSATVGLVGKGLGTTIGGVGQAAGQVAQNPNVQRIISERLGDLRLKSPPGVVAENLGTFLIRGDTQGARDYLAAQAGISRAEADRRIQGFKADLQSALTQIGGTTARAVSIGGWVLFIAMVLGSFAGLAGGGLGAMAALRHPSTVSDRRAIERSRAA